MTEIRVPLHFTNLTEGIFLYQTHRNTQHLTYGNETIGHVRESKHNIMQHKRAEFEYLTLSLLSSLDRAVHHEFCTTVLCVIHIY